MNPFDCDRPPRWHGRYRHGLYRRWFELKFAQNQIHSYDRAHRLTGINSLESYQYDAHNRRVLTTRTGDGLKRYQLYSKSGVLMHTEDQRSNEVIDYINLEGQLIAERSAAIGSTTITTKYQHSDLRGSPTVVTNAAGTQMERSIEQPFGVPYDGIYRDGPGFTGHATDAASGLSYMQQRYYDPIAMRFLSVDPAQSEFSRYSYGANNPYKFVDPDGREIVFADGSTNQFKTQFAEAREYLNAAGADNALEALDNSSVVVTVQEGINLDDFSFSSGSNTITLNLTSGYQVGEGQVQSPALGLLHEAAHALNSIEDHESYIERSDTPDATFDNLEEAKVIQEVETPAAKALGEPTRNFHDGGVPAKS